MKKKKALEMKKNNSLDMCEVQSVNDLLCIVRKICDKMIKDDISPDKLAKMCGIRASVVRNMLYFNEMPQIDVLVLMADRIGLNVVVKKVEKSDKDAESTQRI